MPKTEIDYSNTIIYKITCKDTAIKDVYVGHTTNFVQRKYSHKQSCINAKSTNHKCKLYTIIRENGGWKNWIMEIVTFFNCNDHYEARTKEQEYFLLLNATLNSIEPMPKPKTAINTLPTVIETPKVTQIATGFCCEMCNFKSAKQSNYDKHLTTTKHKRKTIATNIDTQNSFQFICKNCNKGYNARNSLWYHQQNCEPSSADNVQSSQLDKDALIIGLLKQNTELQTQLIELMKTFAPPSIPIN
jgi:hypothetical protein